MNSTIQLRIDTKTKRTVAGIFKSLGLDISSGIKMYFQQVIKTKGIPFPLLTENGYTLEQEKKLLATIRRTEADRKAGRLKTYSSVEEMTKDILAD